MLGLDKYWASAFEEDPQRLIDRVWANLHIEMPHITREFVEKVYWEARSDFESRQGVIAHRCVSGEFNHGGFDTMDGES